MSRWTYRTEKVSVDENNQVVRGMTAGERATFAEASAEIKRGERSASTLPQMIAGFGCIDPVLTADDLTAMPHALLDACVKKIMALSGFKDEEEKKEFDPDKTLPKFPALDIQEQVPEKPPTPHQSS